MTATISDTIQERLREIKPHLEEQFQMRLTAQAYDVADPEVRRMLLQELHEDAGWQFRKDIENWKEEDAAAALYPSFVFRDQEYRIVFNSESRDLNDSKDLLGYIVCHELLHEILDRKIDRIYKLDFITFPLLDEGFSEYGSLDVFSGLYLKEQQSVNRRREKLLLWVSEDQAERENLPPLEEESEQEKFERFTSYDALSLGYVFFREHLGERANPQRLVDQVTALSRENEKEFRQEIRAFLENYV